MKEVGGRGSEMVTRLELPVWLQTGVTERTKKIQTKSSVVGRIVSPRKTRVYTEPQKVTLFGNRVFTDVIR